jgi:hypothetical protein
MSLHIVCTNCNTDDHLTGERREPDIVITCSQCGLHWTRTIAPHCHQCGSTDVVAFGVPLIERARGTQMSITAMHIETLCRTCDADRLAAPHQGHLPPSLGD